MYPNMQKDYFWNTLGVSLQSAVSPLLLIAVTRINGIYDSGLFSFAFSLSIIFFALGLWGGRTYQVSDVKNEFSHRSYIVVRLILAVVMLAGAAAFAVVNNYDATKTAIIVTLVLFKALESVSDSIYGVLQVNNRLYIAGRSLVIKSTLACLAFILIDFLSGNLFLSAMGVVAINIAVILLYDLPHTRRLEDISLELARIGRYTKEALVIMERCAGVFVVIFLATFSLNIPRYFVDKFYPEQVGYYGIIAMPITLIVLFMSFVLQPNIVNLAKAYSKKRYKVFNKTVTKLLLITTLLGVGILVATIAFGVPVLNLVFAVDFSNYHTALLIMVAGGIINALVTVYINLLIIMRHFKAQFYALLFTNVALVAVSAASVAKGGLVVAVSLFAAANVVQLIALVGIYKHSLNSRSIA